MNQHHVALFYMIRFLDEGEGREALEEGSGGIEGGDGGGDEGGFRGGDGGVFGVGGCAEPDYTGGGGEVGSGGEEDGGGGFAAED